MASKKPVVMEKPQRGREMVTREFNQGNRATLQLHEGYVGGQKYLVPDSDLMAMKELVDYKLGNNPRDRYVREYEYTHPNMDDDARFKKINEKLNTVDSESSDEEPSDSGDQKKERTLRFADTISNRTTASETETTSQVSNKTDPVKDETDSASGDTTSELSESTTVGTKKSPTLSKRDSEESPRDSSSWDNRPSEKTQPFEVQLPQEQPDDGSLHFLLSGHVRKNQKPIFIFHQYNGSSPFDNKSPDFSSQKSEGEMDLIIKGKFFQDSILEEINNVPKSLLLKPSKIMIDQRSKIYNERFFELVHIGVAGVQLEGKFIEQADTKRFTPFLSFNVLHPNKKASTSKDPNPANSPAPAMVYIAKPKTNNLFEQKRAKHIAFRVDGKESKAEGAHRVNRPSTSQPTKLHKPRSPSRRSKSDRSEEEVKEYEPHLKRNPSKLPHKRPSGNHSSDRPDNEKDAAGDIGSTGAFFYNCDVNRRRSSVRESKSLLQRLSQMFFP